MFKYFIIFIVFLLLDIIYNIQKKKKDNIKTKILLDNYLTNKYDKTFNCITVSNQIGIYETSNGCRFQVVNGRNEIFDNKDSSLSGYIIKSLFLDELKADADFIINAKISSLNELDINENSKKEEIVLKSCSFITNIIVSVFISEKEMDNVDSIIESLKLKIDELPLQKKSYNIMIINHVNKDKIASFIEDYYMSDGDFSEYEKYIIKLERKEF